jgi:hypothetical protein
MKPRELQGSLEVLTQFQIVKSQKERDLFRELQGHPVSQSVRTNK